MLLEIKCVYPKSCIESNSLNESACRRDIFGTVTHNLLGLHVLPILYWPLKSAMKLVTHGNMKIRLNQVV